MKRKLMKNIAKQIKKKAVKKRKKVYTSKSDFFGPTESPRAKLERIEKLLRHISVQESEMFEGESEDVAALKQDLFTLRMELSKRDVGQKLDRLSFLLSDLISKVENYHRQSLERQDRWDELEEKMRVSFEAKFKDIIDLEKSLERLEVFHEKLSKSRKGEKSQLDVLAKKIDELRQLLLQKRVDIIEERKKEIVSKLPEPPFLEEGKLPELRQLEKPPKRMISKEPVKHRMLFPELAPPKMPLPPRKRKGWLAKIFR